MLEVIPSAKSKEQSVTTATIEQIYAHGSVRQYKTDPIPKDVVETIVAAGQRGSTSSNLQMYSVVAVTTAEKRDQLASLCGNQAHIRQAPVFLAWCADLSRLERAAERRGHDPVLNYAENFLLATVDVAILMQTATVAAESLGLGMCYIGAIRNNPAEVIELLNLPRLVFPISGMTLGWPVRAPRIRPRLPLETILHWETYDTSGEEAYLHEYDQAMIATGIYQGRQAAKPGAEEEMEDYGWTEHCARRIAGPIRPGLSKVLHDQGFELV